MSIIVELADRGEYDRYAAIARAGFDEAAFMPAWAGGRAMPVEPVSGIDPRGQA